MPSMQKKTYYSIKFPLVILCSILCLSGLRWLISSEPWMLDQVANEERLKMTFTDLFLIEGNASLPSVARLQLENCYLPIRGKH